MLKKKEDKKSKVEAERDEYLAGWKRAKADFENYKKRQEQEMADFRKYANVEIILEVISVLDNFDQAYAALPEDLEGHAWPEGIGHIKKQLEDLLAQYGVTEIPALGKEFNPEVHEVVEKSKEPKDKISKVVQRGYQLNDKVIRPAKIIY